MFHILIALAFLFLAAAIAYVSFGEWSYYRQVPSTGLLRFGLLVGFTVFLIILCLYTLGKARSVR